MGLRQVHVEGLTPIRPSAGSASYAAWAMGRTWACAAVEVAYQEVREFNRRNWDMHGKTIVAIAAIVAAAGCANSPKLPAPKVSLVSVRTIEIKDATDPVVLASTGAKRVREFLEIALTHRGYVVCRDCRSDAVATVTVSTYSTQHGSIQPWMHGRDIAIVDWTLVISRDGKTILQERMEDEEPISVDELAGRQVQKVMEQIPSYQ